MSAPERGGMPTRPPSPPRRLRACVACTRAKARCNFQPRNVSRHLCDRCQSMNIDCVPKSTRELRKPRQLKPLASRVATLEKRLEDIVTQVAHSADRPTLNTTAPIRTPESESLRLESSQTTSPSSSSAPSHPVNRHSTSQHHHHANPSAQHPPLDLTWPQASFILDEFRTRFSPYFPFIHIDPETSAQQLLAEKPCLFRAVVVAAAPLPIARSRRIQREVLAYISQRMIADNDRALEVLEGLMICIAWGEFESYLDQHLTTLMYLATGYAHNLGITKMPFPQQCAGDVDTPEDLRLTKLREKLWPAHSILDQRVLLGCYYLLASNSSSFGRENPLSSSYVDVCSQAVRWSTGPSARGDMLIYRLTRLTRLVERIADTFGLPYDRDRRKVRNALREDAVAPLRAELDALAAEVNQNDPDYHIFILHHTYALIRLYEPATHLRPTNGLTPFHLSSLTNCLFAVRDHAEALLVQGPGILLANHNATDSKSQFMTIIASRLAIFTANGWDPAAARRIFDFSDFLDTLAEKLKCVRDTKNALCEKFLLEVGTPQNLAESAEDNDPDDDAGDDEHVSSGVLRDRWSLYMRKARAIRSWYEAHPTATSSKQDNPPITTTSMSAAAAAPLLNTGTGSTAVPDLDMSMDMAANWPPENTLLGFDPSGAWLAGWLADPGYGPYGNPT